MTSDGWIELWLIAATVLFYAMCVLGAVLLTGFSLARLSFGKRVLIAILGGYLIVFLPFFSILWSDNASFADEEVIIFCAMSSIMALAIGWPTAHFATKRLDRMTKFDVDTFS